MRGLRRGTLAGLTAVLLAATTAGPAQALLPEPPARKSDNVAWKTTLDEPNVVSARFSADGSKMYVSTLRGLSVYDVTAPEAPKQLGFLPLPHFENEDVDLSVGNDFVLISNDPSEGKGILYVVSVANPAAPAIIGQMDTGAADLGIDFLPTGISYGTGHTASCVAGPLDDCQYAYLAGTRFGIDIVDLTVPSVPMYATPRNLPVPEASGGLATHDVQFDRAGRALITGGGGTAVYDVANPLAPVLLAKTDKSGKSDYIDDAGADGSTLNDLIHHNSHRLPNRSLAGYSGVSPQSDSDVMVITEEDYSRPTCAGAGSLQTWKINGGEINNLDSWEVEVDPARTALCSAHYFDEDAGLLAQGWYEQGTRFLDVSSPSKIRQVGFWIPQKNVTWGAVFNPRDRGVVYALDHPRGIDVLRIKRGPAPDVTPPRDTSGQPAPSLCAIRPRTDGRSCDSAAAAGGRAKLKLRVRGGRGARPGRRVRYRFGVRNVGSAPAEAVKVRVRLPRLLKHLRGGRRRKGSRVVTFSLGRIAPGKGKSRALKARVKPTAPGGTQLKVRAKVSLRAQPTRRLGGPAARTAAMPTVTAPALDWAPRRRFVAAYGLCRVYVRD